MKMNVAELDSSTQEELLKTGFICEMWSASLMLSKRIQFRRTYHRRKRIMKKWKNDNRNWTVITEKYGEPGNKNNLEVERFL